VIAVVAVVGAVAGVLVAGQGSTKHKSATIAPRGTTTLAPRKVPRTAAPAKTPRTTVAPTTVAPTTAAPTTVAPTTAPPTSTTTAPPAGAGITAFSGSQVDSDGQLDWVSCPTTTFCMAVDAYSGSAYTWNGSSWSGPTRADPSSLSGSNLGSLSCATPTFCMIFAFEASDSDSETQTIDAVAWNGTTWAAPQKLTDSNGDALSVSCPTATFCMATDALSSWVYNSGTWSSPTTLPGTDGFPIFDAMSCASPTFCLAVADSTITWNGQSWSSDPNTVAMELVTGLSCPTSSFCEVVGTPEGTITASLGASWTPQGWSGTSTIASNFPSNSTGLRSVSCPAAGDCYAVSDQGQAFRLANGQWGAAIGAGSPGEFLNSISCASPNFCAIVDEDGEALTPS
jgi:hypothetical protein